MCLEVFRLGWRGSAHAERVRAATAAAAAAHRALALEQEHVQLLDEVIAALDLADFEVDCEAAGFSRAAGFSWAEGLAGSDRGRVAQN
jgi:hypothetical protein